MRLRDVLVPVPEVDELGFADGASQGPRPVLDIRHREASASFSGKEEGHRRRQEPLDGLVDGGQVPEKVLLIWKNNNGCVRLFVP